jgi:hypothetical protein
LRPEVLVKDLTSLFKTKRYKKILKIVCGNHKYLWAFCNGSGNVVRGTNLVFFGITGNKKALQCSSLQGFLK